MMKFSSGLVRRITVAAFSTVCALGLPATGALALEVGYYDMVLGAGDEDTQAGPIVAAGHNPVRLFDLTTVDLSAVDILFVQNPSNGAYGVEYLSRLAAIEAAVANGLILIIHDHWVDQAETILPGSGGFDIQRSFSDANNIDIRDATTRVSDGAGGLLSDSSLDGGNFSSHGFADADSLPAGAKLILSRTRGISPNEDWIVTFSYIFGEGAVIYSSIPLVLFLDVTVSGEPAASFRGVYAPNVIDYAALLALRIPDLAVTVDDGVDEAVPGESVDYAVVVSNFGPGEAVDAPVAIDFSSFLTDVTWTCTPAGTALCTASGSGDVDDTVTLASGETLTYVATGTIDPGATGMMTTSAMVTNPVGEDPAPANNTDADTDLLTPVADVAIAKAGPARVDSGQPITYTLVARNAGPSDASGVRVSDPTPSGLTLVSAGAPCIGGFPCDLGALPAGGSVLIAVTYAVPVHFGTEPIVNRASIAAEPSDPVANNTVTSTTAVNEDAAADLALSVVAPLSAAAGSTVRYRVQIENRGPHDAQNVMLTHTPPAGLTLLSATAPCASGLPCALDTVNAGAVVIVDVTFGIPGAFSGSLLYSATASSTTADPVPANNSGSAGPALGADTVDLVIEKVGPTVAELDDDVTFTLTITNRGPAAATGVMLEDPSPDGLVFVSASAPCTGGLAAPPCDLGTLAAGESVEVTATWNIPGDYSGANPVANVATVSAVEVEAFTDDDVATALIGIGEEVTDLRIEKSGPSETVAGGPLTFTLTVENAGPGIARSVALSDAPPAGLVPTSATEPCDTAPFFPCDLGDMAAGETVVVGVTFDIAPDHGFPNPLTNAASVASDNVDTDPANNDADATSSVVRRADLRVTKTDGLLQTANSLFVTYTMIVTNDGPSDAVGVGVSDTFPAELGPAMWCRAPGLDTVCAPANSGDIDDTVDLAAGDSVTYTATAQVIAETGTLSNTVVVAPPDGVVDPDPSDNMAIDDDTVIVPSADLVVGKTGPTEAVPGTPLVYLLTVTNTGAGVAEGVILRDPTPAGLSDPTISAPCDQGFPCTLGDLLPSAVVQLTVTYDVPAGYDGPEPITNTAMVETTSPDADPENDSVTVPTPVQRKADLDITKVNSVESPDALVPGAPVSYTIRVTNLGPSDALGARVVDTLPSPPMALLLTPTWTCTASAGASCANASGTGAFDEIVDLPVSGILTFVLDAIVEPSATTAIENTARVIPPEGVIDPVPGNDVARDADGVRPTADLGIVKSNDTAVLVPGEAVAYTIVVRNAGPSDASGVAVTDQPPVALTDPTWTCDGTGGAVCASTSGFGAIDETVDLPAGSEATYVLTAIVDPSATGTLANTAEVAPPPIVVVDPNPDNDTATDTDTLIRLADLHLTKTGPGLATRGMPLTFILTAGNAGPSDATVVITDPAPPSLGAPTVIETTVPPPAAPRCAGGFPCLFDLAAGEEATFTVTYDVPANYSGPDPIVNRAAISGAGIAGETDDATDPDPSDNIAASAVPVERAAVADLAITKVAPAIAAVDSTVTYRLTVTNHGPDDAPAVLLSESIPEGLVFDTATAPCETGFDCALGTLNVGASRTIEATFSIPPDFRGPIANTALVSTTAVDPNPDNDSDDALTTLTAGPFELALTQTGPLQAVVGSEVTYTLVVSNQGPATATNTRLEDPSPPGLGMPTVTAPCANGFPCILATVDPDETLTVDATFTVPLDYTGPDPIVNVARVIGDPNDAFADNNTATWFTGISAPAADLEVIKHGPATVAAGATVSYALIVRNLGPGAATAVTLDDPGPLGTAFVAASAPCTAGFPCELGDLPAGSAVVVRATFAVSSALADGLLLDNTATVTNTAPDPDTRNNQDFAATTVFVEADLAITKQNGVDTVIPGTTVTYTIAVTNLGPSDAPGARVTDLFPPELTGVTWTCTATPGSSCAAGAAGSGDVDRSVDIAANGTVTYTANGTVDPSSIVPLTNTATAMAPVSPAVPDPNPDNNSDTDSDPVTPVADLAITKTDGSDTAVPGQPVTYTITVHNLGPSDVPGADVTDLFPAELTDVTWTCAATNGASCGAGGSVEILDTAMLPAGGMAVYTATATVLPGAIGTVVNTAGIAPSPENQPPVVDPNPDNDDDDDTNSLTPRADIAVTKENGTDTVTPGAQTVYTITVANLGPSDAPRVQVGDTFQAPVTGASWTCVPENGGDCLAAAGGGSGDIAVDIALPAGARVVFTATADIDPAATGLLINTATSAVPPDLVDPVAENDADTDTDSLILEADLAATKKNGVSTVVVGTEVTYAITVSNNGPSNITGATVTDLVPAALLGAAWTCSAGAGAACTASGTGDIDDVVNLEMGNSVTYTLKALLGPDAGTTLTNTATVRVPADANDPNPGNNSGTDEDPVRRQADLAVGLVHLPDPQVVGGKVTLTLRAENFGPSPAVGSRFTLTLPAGLAFSTSATCTHDNGVVTCVVGGLDAGATAEAVVIAEAAIAGTWPLIAEVTSLTTELEPDNNTIEREATVLVSESLIFADGFEAGDVSAWSSSSGALPPASRLVFSDGFESVSFSAWSMHEP